MQNVFILGSTGSIGVNTLNVIRNFPDRFNVSALTANSNTTILLEQIQTVPQSRLTEKIGELEWAHIYCCNASKAITFLDKSYDVIFIDPPYSNPTTNNLLVNLAKSKLLGENSIIVVCHANRFPLDTNYDGLHLIEKRRYGDTFISIYQKEV